jgi:hypothetical protein
MTEPYDPNVFPDGAEIRFNDDSETRRPDRVEFLRGGFVRATYKTMYKIEVYPPSVIEGVYTHTGHVEDEGWWDDGSEETDR